MFTLDLSHSGVTSLLKGMMLALEVWKGGVMLRPAMAALLAAAFLSACAPADSPVHPEAEVEPSFSVDRDAELDPSTSTGGVSLEFGVKAWTFFGGSRCPGCGGSFPKFSTDTIWWAGKNTPETDDDWTTVRDNYKGPASYYDPETVYAGGAVKVEVNVGPGYRTVAFFESDFQHERAYTGGSASSSWMLVRLTAYPTAERGCKFRYFANARGRLTGNPVVRYMNTYGNRNESFTAYFECAKSGSPNDEDEGTPTRPW